MAYHIHVMDEDGRTASWASHTNRGVQSLMFPDYINAVIVIEHPTAITFIGIDADGEITLDVVEQ